MTELGRKLMDAAREEREAMLSLLLELAGMETPTDVPESQVPIQDRITAELEDIGFRVRRLSGRKTGGCLLALPRNRPRERPAQLLLGHCDTVWARGTLETMPLVMEGDRLRGPGVFDMKAGLTQMIVALRILRRLGLEPEVTPVILVNSDEEIGSPESGKQIRRVARTVVRALIPEPGMGPEGKLKTVRKGWSNFTVKVTGKAAHAGLDPRGGASAILELSHLIQELHGMTDLDGGVTVNVGVVSGGTRPNVIAPTATAEVDVRVLTNQQAEEVRERILALTTTVPGTRLEVLAKGSVPPLEGTPRNRALWEAARAAGADLGLTLEEGTAGGGSDGNTTSQYTATLDGLGAVGDGAHAAHEFLFVEKLVERCALLARLLLLAP
ncbi:MAG: M20 family metallopeptidase [Longimicrobiales bacterium]